MCRALLSLGAGSAHTQAVRTTEQWRTEVGEEIERQRTAAGLSVRDAAKRAGVSESMWRQIESGRRVLEDGTVVAVNPKATTMAKVRAALSSPDLDAVGELRVRVEELARLVARLSAQHEAMGGALARLTAQQRPGVRR